MNIFQQPQGSVNTFEIYRGCELRIELWPTLFFVCFLSLNIGNSRKNQILSEGIKVSDHFVASSEMDLKPKFSWSLELHWIATQVPGNETHWDSNHSSWLEKRQGLFLCLSRSIIELYLVTLNYLHSLHAKCCGTIFVAAFTTGQATIRYMSIRVTHRDFQTETFI